MNYLSLALISFVSFALGGIAAFKVEHERAVAAGAGEYRIDHQTGKKTFHYFKFK